MCFVNIPIMYICTIYAYECDVLSYTLSLAWEKQLPNWYSVPSKNESLSLMPKKPHKRNDLEEANYCSFSSALISKLTQHSMKLSYIKFRNCERITLAGDWGTDLITMRCHWGKPLGRTQVFSFEMKVKKKKKKTYVRTASTLTRIRIIRSINLAAAG